MKYIFLICLFFAGCAPANYYSRKKEIKDELAMMDSVFTDADFVRLSEDQKKDFVKRYEELLKENVEIEQQHEQSKENALRALAAGLKGLGDAFSAAGKQKCEPCQCPPEQK